MRIYASGRRCGAATGNTANHWLKPVTLITYHPEDICDRMGSQARY